MEEHKVKSIHGLSKELGVSRRLLTNLYKNDFDFIDRNALDKLCNKFNCNVDGIIKRDT